MIGHLAGWRNEPESNLNSIEVDAGTRLEERIDVEPSGVLRLLTPLIKGRMESDFKVSHARMKERVEALA